jgi:hypothetical protein
MLLCVLAGVTGATEFDEKPAAGMAIVAMAALGVAIGVVLLLRTGRSEHAGNIPWTFFLLASAVEGFAKPRGIAGYAIGVVATLALVCLTAIWIHQLLKRKRQALPTSGAGG